MSRLLVLGVGPLPFEQRKRAYGSSLRTWHFIRPLLKAGHTVHLIAMQLPDPHHEENLPQIMEIPTGIPDFTYYSVNELYVFMDLPYLQMHCDAFQPEAVIGINTHASGQACRLNTNAPIWADLNGWVMAEAQAKAHRYQDDHFLEHFWKQEEPVLKRADRISVVSTPQKFACIGELAAVGRLTRESFGYDFLTVIPNSVNHEEPVIGPPVLSRQGVSNSDFVVLWSGGYNTWTDIPTLFEGLTLAMEKNPRIRFVSTGGAISGHDDKTYPDFLNRIQSSPYKDRFTMLGWVDGSDIPPIYTESHLGLNVDGDNYETLFGARNRLNAMMSLSLPVLSTPGTEVMEELTRNQLALTFQRGSAKDLADKILWAADHPSEIKQMGFKGKEYIKEHWADTVTTRELQKWAESPSHAPDYSGGKS